MNKATPQGRIAWLSHANGATVGNEVPVARANKRDTSQPN